MKSLEKPDRPFSKRKRSTLNPCYNCLFPSHTSQGRLYEATGC